MPELDHEARLRLLEQANEAFERGDEEEWLRISQQRPMAPHLAMAAKKIMGSEYLRNSGFNLSLAEEKYGPNWLNN